MAFLPVDCPELRQHNLVVLETAAGQAIGADLGTPFHHQQHGDGRMPRIAEPTVLLSGIALAFTIGSVNAQATVPPAPSSLETIDWSKSELVTIIMTDYEFTPRRLAFHHGVPTRLHLVNDGAEIHDFTAPDFFKTIDLRDPSVMRSSGIGIPVEPHQQKDVQFIARMPGHFGLICADHDWAGMTADILVE
jgi:uncharacterized cupredoxin-like copper-binding protein